MDDGGRDRCPEMCDAFQAEDSRIRVIHKENGGLSDARNAGLEIASGRYVTLIDSDDFILPDYIEYLYRLLTGSEADMSVCQKQYVDEQGNPITGHGSTASKVVDGNSQCMWEFFHGTGLETTAWGKLYKREMFDAIRYPYGKYHEDIYTTYRLVAQCQRIAIGGEMKYCYRQRSASITSGGFSKKRLDSVEGSILRSEFVEAHYPECRVPANAGVLWAANNCAMQMIRAGCKTREYIDYLQKQYRRYEWSFLRGDNRIGAKLFSLFAFLNLKLLICCGIAVKGAGKHGNGK